MNFLSTIIETKREEVARAKRNIPRSQLYESPFYHRRIHSLTEALNNADPAIIAEIKKASPSKGLLRKDFQPVEIATSYQRNGAAAISVLTDEQFFKGSLHILRLVREAVNLPLLRKDFIIDSYQLPEAKSAGADAVLLIVAALEKSQLQELHLEAKELGLDVLVEVHNETEIDSLDFDLINLVGVNNRDLTTFQVDVTTSYRLRRIIPSKIPVVGESGIATSDDIRSLLEHQIYAVLIGETFMRAEDPGQALHRLLDEVHGR